MDRFRETLHRWIKELSAGAQQQNRQAVIGIGQALDDITAHLDRRQQDLAAALIAQGNAQQQAVYDAWRLAASGIYLDLDRARAELAELRTQVAVLEAQLAEHREESHVERAEIKALLLREERRRRARARWHGFRRRG